MASIQHLKKSRRFRNGGWLVRYRGPENQTLRKTFATREAAQDFMATVRISIKDGSYIGERQGKTLFREVAEDWFGTTAKLRTKTRDGYRTILDHHILPALGSHAIGRVDSRVIERFLASCPGSVGTQRTSSELFHRS